MATAAACRTKFVLLLREKKSPRLPLREPRAFLYARYGSLVAAASAALAATRPLRHRRLHPLGERSARHLTPKGALLLVQDLQGLLLRGAALAQHLVPVHRSPRATRSAGATLALTATEAAALLAAALATATLALTRSARTSGAAGAARTTGATHRETVGTDDIHDRLALIFGDLQGFTVARIEPCHRGIPLQGNLIEAIHLPFIQNVGQRVRRGTTRSIFARSTLAAPALALTRTTLATAAATRSAGAARATRSHVVDLLDLLRRQAKFLLHRAHANHEHRAGLHAAASAGAALTAGATRSTLLRQGSRRHHSDGGESDDSVRQFHF